MLSNEEFWSYQHSVYQSLPYDRKIRYESWQPGRWAANRAAVKNLLPYLENVNSVCEVGAGSAAFSLEMGKQCGWSLKAVDLCPTAAKYAQQIAQDMQIPIDYSVGDLFSYREKSDIVLSLGVIEHFTPEEQRKFIRHCKDISNRYVLIAIPNQDSTIFRNYVSWSNRRSKSYEDEHQPLTTSMLSDLCREAGLRIVHTDGFQVFLSERAFWNDTPISEIPLYENLLQRFQCSDESWREFPCMDFAYQDIPRMVEIESSLHVEERLQNGFMSYVLAEI